MLMRPSAMRSASSRAVSQRFASRAAVLRAPARALSGTPTSVSPSYYAREGIESGGADGQETAEFEVRSPFKLHKLRKGPEAKVTVTKEQLLRQYETLTYYRRMQLVAFNMYQQRKIRGFCHLYDGQEAITVGMEEALTWKDSVITGYRDHTIAMGRGASGYQVLAELMGKRDGSSKGKGGSMHFYSAENNFYGGNGIVGAQVPVGTGVAFAHKARGYDGVCFSLFGDGAANQGQIYEAANMAALWKLPVVFACENNYYAMGTSVERHAASRDYHTRGDYIPGIWVDGMDTLAVASAVKFAKDYTTAGKGPLYMELNTYRYRGHSMSDPGVSYRAREEVDETRRERDCIELVKKRLIEQEWATVPELKAVQKRIEKEIAADLKRATAAAEPPLEDVYADVYAGEQPEFQRLVEYEQSVRAARQ